MFLSIGMLKQKYFLADIFILSAEKQPIKLSWRKIECLQREIILSYPSLLDFFPPNGTEIPTNPFTVFVFFPKNI